MNVRTDYTCPLEVVHDLMRGKWKTIIIFQLRDGAKSPSQLERSITGIGQKMLLEQLAELCEQGIVDKASSGGFPLHVEYTLTSRGLRLLEAVRIMQDVGVDYMIEHGLRDLLDKPVSIPTKK